MFSYRDEGRGTVITFWKNIRGRVRNVAPEFAQLVDEISPDNNYPLFLSYYPYGTLKGDTISTFLPGCDGQQHRLNNVNLPKEITKHLSYGVNSSPLAMLLDKRLELFIDLRSKNLTIPCEIYSPGDFFPFARILSNQSKRTYAPNKILSLSAGARSVFMLPNISCATNHQNLQRDFNIKAPTPKTLYEHWNIFKQILDSKILDNSWRACVIYFSEKWVESIHHDKKWLSLKMFLHELAWRKTEYTRNKYLYDIMFSTIQEDRNLKPNPYLVDTARHLFMIALGHAPGFAPTVNEETIPVGIIQRIYSESYGLKQYVPTVVQPQIFCFESEKLPIYYSLKYPSTQNFSPKSRLVSTISEIRELSHIMENFCDDLNQEKSMYSDTVLKTLAQQVKFEYIHNSDDPHQIIKSSHDFINTDHRFSYMRNDDNSVRLVSGDARFLKGCVSIKTMKSTALPEHKLQEQINQENHRTTTDVAH